MRVTRTGSGGTGGNTAVIRRVKILFQLFPGTQGSDADRGIVGADYKVKVNGRQVATGTTAADGAVEVEVPSGAQVVLTVLGTDFKVTALGAIEPKVQTKGVQRRLLMLGHDIGGIDGILGARTDEGLLSFQADEASDPTGVNDAATQNALATRFGE